MKLKTSLKTVVVSVEILQIKLINYRLLLYNNTEGDVMVLNYIVPLVITLVLVALFVTLCTIFLKNASEEKKLIPIKVVFFLLVALEFCKIFYLIATNGRYEPSRYPIVFCSMVMFAYPLFCFKKNRFSEVAKSFSIIPAFVIFALFVGIQWQFNMSLIQGHSYLYHGAMLAVAIYLLTSKLYKFELKKCFPLFIVLSGYILLSTVLSLFIGGDISYFGPNSSYLGFIYNNFGYVVGNCFVVILFFVLCVAVYGIIALCQRKKKKADSQTEVQNV